MCNRPKALWGLWEAQCNPKRLKENEMPTATATTDTPAPSKPKRKAISTAEHAGSTFRYVSMQPAGDDYNVRIVSFVADPSVTDALKFLETTYQVTDLTNTDIADAIILWKKGL